MTTLSTLPSENEAVTSRKVSTVTVHVPVPEQGPFVHPSNFDVLEAMAVSVTIVPLAKKALHAPGPPMFEQSMPAGELVIVPVPAPANLTESCCVPPPVPPLPPLPPVPPVVVLDPVVLEGLPVVTVGPVDVLGPVVLVLRFESPPPEQPTSANPRTQPMTLRAMLPLPRDDEPIHSAPSPRS
jgi:hypothetical protein